MTVTAHVRKWTCILPYYAFMAWFDGALSDAELAKIGAQLDKRWKEANDA